jgi:hypothetical protein
MSTAALQAEQSNETALGVDTLVSQIHVSAPTDIVTVKGRVTRLAAYPKDKPKWMFGDLQGTDVTLTFKCPVSDAPRREGETVVLTGTIKVIPSRVHTGMDVRLEGEKVGTWTPGGEPERAPIQIERELRQIPLSAFLNRLGKLKGLHLIATQRGLDDFNSTLANNNLKSIFEYSTDANFTSRKSLLAEAQKAKMAGAKAIVFLRGGSDSKTLELWDDPEFIQALISLNVHLYSAIGHSDTKLLSDKYFDASFSTPTAFASKVIQIYEHLKKRAEEREELEQFKKKVVALEDRLAKEQKSRDSLNLEMVKLKAQAEAQGKAKGNGEEESFYVKRCKDLEAQCHKLNQDYHNALVSSVGKSDARKYRRRFRIALTLLLFGVGSAIWWAVSNGVITVDTLARLLQSGP